MSWRFRTHESEHFKSLALSACDGCGRCSAVCPVAEAMSLAPAQFVSMANCGQDERLLRCSSAWICTDCRACTETCPQGVKVHGLMQWVRTELTTENYYEEVPVDVEMIAAWHEAFKATALKAGRAGHWWTFLRYRMASLDFFTNLALGGTWLISGRLRLRPHLPSLAIRRLAKKLKALQLKEKEADLPETEPTGRSSQ